MLAFHGIWSAYGFWLPNEPAGSWSSWVASWELYRYGGGVTPAGTTRSVAAWRDPAWVAGARRVLKHPAVRFDPRQMDAVGDGIGEMSRKAGYRLLALAVLREHVHAVVEADDRDPAQAVGALKRGGSDGLKAAGVHPFDDGRGEVVRSCWADQSWRVFLDTVEEVGRAVRYVEENPEREGLPRQAWGCVRAMGERR